MPIQKVEMKDYPAVLTLFKAVKADLAQQGNDQWKWIYPNRLTHKADIRNGTMYGLQEGNDYLAVITLDHVQSDKYAAFEWKDKEGRACCIHRLAVHPKHQGRGLGKSLLQYVEQLAQSQGYTSVRIDVYSTNAGAIALYQKYGYARVGEVRYPMRKQAYITMEKLLDSFHE